MPVPNKIYVNPSNDQTVTVQLFDKGTGLYFDATAVVRATLYDWQGNPVPYFTSIAFVFQVGSQGVFTGSVTEQAVPAVGSGYTLFIVADQGAAHGEWNIETEVVLRRQ